MAVVDDDRYGIFGNWTLGTSEALFSWRRSASDGS